jgi:hypothetical protein
MNRKRNLNLEEVILQLGKLMKSGNRKVARKSMERIAKLGKIDERAVEIIRLEKMHSEDK